VNNVFIKTSVIKKNASRQAMNYYQSHATKVIKNIIGVNPLNREWVEEADSILKKGLQSKGFVRVKYLIQALEKIYFCAYILQESQYTDREINIQIQKAEISYINSCLDFIEQNIHSSDTILKSFSLLIFAVDVVHEVNPAMGDKYRQILTRYNVLFNSFSKITELCGFSNNNFTQKQTQQIKALIGLHSSALKMYPTLKAELIEIVINKLDEYIIEFNDDIACLMTEEGPSLKKVYKKYNDYYEMFKPLTELFEKKRYKEILQQREKYVKLTNVLEHDYQEWLKVYQYFSLPRNKIDETKILNVINSINKTNDLLISNFIEFKDRSPTPTEIKEFLSSLMNEKGKDSIINYIKVENDLLNAPESDKKNDEIIRFIKHLNEAIQLSLRGTKQSSNLCNEKMSEVGISNQLKNELVRMKAEFMSLLDQGFEYKIKKFLSTNPSESKLKHFFEGIMSSLYDLNDLEKITYWQNTKKNIIKAMHEVPIFLENLKKDFIVMDKLPDSVSKQTLKDKIINDISKINEILPIMVLYQIGDFHEHLTNFTEIEKKIKHKPKTQQEQSRLIVLDKFTTKNIIIYRSDVLKIGREESSDIILKSEWVSSIHCTIDFQKGMLFDNGSTNGTKIKENYHVPSASTPLQKRNNMNQESMMLDSIKVFSVADAFDIHVEKFESFYIFNVVKVFDNELLSNDREYIKNLFNTDFMWIKKHSSVSIDIYTGNIKETDFNNLNEIVITNKEFFNITDKENCKETVTINENEDFNTDRFTFTVS